MRLVLFLLVLRSALCGQEQEECSVAIVEIAYADLIGGGSRRILDKIGEAYGANGLGILAVTGIPEEIDARRKEVLSLGRKLALLPASTLEKYERPELNYVVGWSRGREKFKGVEDVAKGSWYANGLYAQAALHESQALREKYPASTAEPRWPTSNELGTELEPIFRKLGADLFQVSRHLLRHCDLWLDQVQLPWHLKLRKALASFFQRTSSFWKKQDKYSPHNISLERVTHELSRLHVARLLHYFPDSTTKPTTDWCGWHNDNSVLTALAPAIFTDDSTGLQLNKAPTNAGLYVQPRSPKHAQPIHVLPPTTSPYLLFQIGEAAQILSGGLLRATPHAVMRGDNATSISRDTFALFVEPHWDFPLNPPLGVPLSRVYDDDDNNNNDNLSLIPPLRTRLPKVPVDFAQFLADSVTEYYKP